MGRYGAFGKMKSMTTGRTKAVFSSDADHSWDLMVSDKGNLPANGATFDRKYEEWMKRDWSRWLKASLTFPFAIKRKEDEDDAYFTDVAKHSPFRLGHVMQAIREAVAKFWLEPMSEVAESYSMSAHELHELLDIAVERKKVIKRYWNEHFSA